MMSRISGRKEVSKTLNIKTWKKGEENKTKLHRGSSRTQTLEYLSSIYAAAVYLHCSVLFF